MKFITSLGVFFYTVVFFIIGGFLIAVALGLLSSQDIYRIVDYMQINLNSRIITGLCGFLLIVVNISLGQIMLGRIEKEKTIAFNTPSGQVTIALQAVEDLIKRLTQNFMEIKEMRPDVVANKRGVEVSLKVVLQKEANIPELTGHLQDMIRTKIQEMLGIEEQITVKVHVSKIVSYTEKKKKGQAADEVVPPFGGYARK
ncbi:alkaline shock response membrane anchor protein AmaP [Candidatus Omnitrophota bacterium]